jgi:hypothetical protein
LDLAIGVYMVGTSLPGDGQKILRILNRCLKNSAKFSFIQICHKYNTLRLLENAVSKNLIVGLDVQCYH